MDFIDKIMFLNFNEPNEEEMKMLNELELSTNRSQYKEYHENYFKYNEGSTALEPFFSIYFTFICTLYVCINGVRLRSWFQLILEYLIIAFPMMALNILFSTYMNVINLIVTIMFALVVLSKVRKFKFGEAFKKPNNFSRNHSYTLTCARGLTYLITAFCIFAVDFRAFPKKFAKTWKFGYSLMDTGTGLFVVLSGLVHKFVSNERFSTIFFANVRFLSILGLLGLIRFGLIYFFDYQEQVQEYGIHWNFFYSLAVSKLFALVFMYFNESPLTLAVMTLSIHEILLIKWETFILDFDLERVDFLTSNKEGVCSSLGYVALYLFGVYFKSFLFDTKLPRYKVLFKFIAIGCISFVAFFIVNQIRPISRVMANTAYCMYIITLLMFFIIVLYFFEVLYSENGLNFEPPHILTLVNENGLLFFLIANLLTGLANLSMMTLLQPTGVCFFHVNFIMVFMFALLQNFKDIDFII